MNPFRRRWLLITTVHHELGASITEWKFWRRSTAEWYGNALTTRHWVRNKWIANYEVRRS